MVDNTAEHIKTRLAAAFDAWKSKDPSRTKKQLASLCEEKLGVPCTPQTVNGWFKTGRMDKKWLSVVAEILEVDLLTGEKSRSKLPLLLGAIPIVGTALGAFAYDQSRREEEFTPVQRADVKFSNGSGAVVFHQEDKAPLSFRTEFLKRIGISRGNAVVVEAIGDCNEPKIIDGSMVLVDMGNRERLNGEFFAFRVDGELQIKRLQSVKDVGILATAENPNFHPKQRLYQGDVDFEVIGKAVWMGTLL